MAYLQNIVSENVTALTSEYEINATLISTNGPLTGVLQCCSAPTGGAANIEYFYQEFLNSRFATVNLANESYSVLVSANGSARVDSNFTIYGNHTAPCGTGNCAYAGNAVLVIKYVPQGNDWLISYESWTFVTFNFCPTIDSPSCSSALTAPNWNNTQ